ncbi:hypothetical protein [Anoxynatronum buryatiense]|uniref:Uncharacterized protein n=1 Tax=Anoxynatronum buryatiense TaxID=489973 RepID=A0AA46AHU5_9CLOT|nr:hypothetical protein [Anoxynatronum buryatiense]SMP43695.1 hypothetical protein SAMN06296020_10284 [Anoxynatronum buryatiense]
MITRQKEKQRTQIELISLDELVSKDYLKVAQGDGEAWAFFFQTLCGFPTQNAGSH